jgi:hypothetical protein
MENIHKIKILAFSFIIGCIFSTQGQNDFFVHFYKGVPFVEQHDSIKPISRGSIIEKDAKLIINKKDVVHLIDDKGEVYKISKTGKYKRKELKKLDPEKNSSSFSKSFFTSLWIQFTNAAASKKNKSAVVYRGDDIFLMQNPIDSAKVYTSEIRFEWKSVPKKTKDYYLIIKDVETGAISKFGTPTNELTLFVDDINLKQSKSYQWAITETKYAHENELSFFNFSILNKSEFKAIEPDIKELTKYFKLLGLSKKEIKATISEDYKIYY